MTIQSTPLIWTKRSGCVWIAWFDGRRSKSAVFGRTERAAIRNLIAQF